jgi:hypothetical protein
MRIVDKWGDSRATQSGPGDPHWVRETARGVADGFLRDQIVQLKPLQLTTKDDEIARNLLSIARSTCIDPVTVNRAKTELWRQHWASHPAVKVWVEECNKSLIVKALADGDIDTLLPFRERPEVAAYLKDYLADLAECAKRRESLAILRARIVKLGVRR